MKKIISILLTFLMFNTYCFAATEVPDFLAKPIMNYTADYDISIDYENSDDFVALLEEMELLDDTDKYVDIRMLLTTLLSGKSTMNVQLDMSEDYSKIKAGITADTNQLIELNPNLKMDIDSRMGMWLDMDLSDEKSPVYDIVYIQPFLNKYLKIDASRAFEEVGIAPTELFDKAKIDALETETMKLFVANSTMQKNGNRYEFKMDNDAFLKYISEALGMAFKNSGIKELEETEIPSLDGLKLLGEDGIRTVVTVSFGKIKSIDMAADISIDLPSIGETLFGEPWELESLTTLDFTFSMKSTIKKAGSTKVDFPVLTDENSFEIELEEDTPLYDDSYTDTMEYPVSFIYEYCDNLPVIDDEIYVPLRQTIESAYADSAQITFDRGALTLTSDYFNGFKTIKFTVGSDVVYTDDVAHTLKPSVIIDETTYTPASFFTEILGWSFDSADYDMKYKNYSYSFDARIW